MTALNRDNAEQQVALLVPDNASKIITPERIRDSFQAIIDSYINLIDPAKQEILSVLEMVQELIVEGVDLGDTIFVKEANGFITIINRLTDDQFIVVDNKRFRNNASGRPTILQAIEGEAQEIIQGVETSNITTNPKEFQFVPANDAWLNGITLKLNNTMNNVRITVLDDLSSKVEFFYPNKLAVASGEGGVQLVPGIDDKADIDFDIDSIPIGPSRHLRFRIEADSVDLKGDGAQVPYFEILRQNAQEVEVALLPDVASTPGSVISLNLDANNTVTIVAANTPVQWVITDLDADTSIVMDASDSADKTTLYDEGSDTFKEAGVAKQDHLWHFDLTVTKAGNTSNWRFIRVILRDPVTLIEHNNQITLPRDVATSDISLLVEAVSTASSISNNYEIYFEMDETGSVVVNNISRTAIGK